MNKLFSAAASRVLMVVFFLGLHHTVATRSTPAAASRMNEKVKQGNMPAFPARAAASAAADPDTDGDGVTDARDADDDNDGILDRDEVTCTITKTVIPDDIPASSPDGTANSFANGNYSELNKPGLNSGTSWSSPNGTSNFFVGVVFPDPTKISSIDIQGRADANQWVTSFTLEGTKESVATGSQGTTNTWISLGTFTGNSDRNTIVTNQINSAESDWMAIRIVPKTWTGHPSLRFAVNICLPPDTDKDGVADQLDTDSDNDGLSDNLESQPTGNQIAKSGIDTDRDGVDNAYDPDNGGKKIVPVDTDKNGIPDYKDTDSDGDGTPDNSEAPPQDTNGNSIPDYREVADSDSDGVPDHIETRCGSGSLSYEYYDFATAPTSVNNIPASVATATGTTGTGTINSFGVATIQARHDAGDTDNYGIRFTGFINIAIVGDYTFYLSSDDGSRLLIDGAQVIDHDGAHGMSERQGIITLSKGPHKIEVLYMQVGTTSVLTLSYENTSIPKQAVPSSILSACAAKDIDSDGDGTANKLEADSDGDGCPDGKEATGTDVSSAYHKYAVDKTLNLCPDADGDGVGDLLDVDDDGDGISDIEEAGCGSFHQPFTSLAQAHGMPSGRYSFNIGGKFFQADVDNSEGGGWVLVLQYVHKGGANPALKVLAAGADFPVTSTAALGTDESAKTTKWGHAGNAALSQFTEDFEIRFYGATNAHARIIHFKAIEGSPGLSYTAYVKTGTGEFEGVNSTSRHTLLTEHTATIPASVNSRHKDQGDLALTNFPFYQWTTSHWGIAGNGNRWEVDDFPGGGGNSTIHRVWVRSTTLSTAACSNEEADTDKDGIPDRMDGDSDGDGIADKDEKGTPPTGKDTDGDGLDDAYDIDNGGQSKPKDTDGDGVPDYLDADADNDGITDRVEGQTTSGHKNPSGIDANKNGIDDVYEGLTPTDTDGDKIPDFKDTDTDGDGTPDNSEAPPQDTNGNGIPDYREVADSDSDGLPDHIETRCGSGSLSYEYYDFATAPTSVNNIPASVATATGTTGTGTINSFGVATIQARHDAGDTDNYGIRFTGFIHIATTGDYTFYLSSDDGSRLLIDGAQVIDHDGAHVVSERQGITTLSKGPHKIEVLYMQVEKVAVLTLSYENASIPRQAVPFSMLSACAAKDIDSDGDGIANKLEVDSDGDGCPDGKEAPGPDVSSAYHKYAVDKTLDLCPDADGDGVSDLLDSDDDGDGISDIEEAGCGSFYQPFTSLSQAHGMPTGRYNFSIGGKLFQADVDDSEGGDWMLVLQYVHKGGTNPALTVLAAGADFPVTSTAALGTDESTEATKWGHAGNAALSQFTEDFEIRFYGATNAHARIIHFKTMEGSPGPSFTAYVKTGKGGFSTDIKSTSRHTVLTGHSAVLPAFTDDIIIAKEPDLALTHYPFYRIENALWGIAGSGHRWEVDDNANGSGNSTIHRVWARPVKNATLPAAAPCTEADSDKDGIPNRMDGDSDGDGIADKDEIGTPPTGKDTDGDGIDDAYDADNGGQPIPKDTDGDGVPDYVDADSDNDGITDRVEGQTTSGHKTPSGIDANKNGIDDVYEGLTPTDTDGDKIPDFKDTDADGDNAPDWIEGFDNDGSGDVLNDLTDRANAFKAAGGDPSFYNNSIHSDSDKIPDWLEDTNNDGKPNFLDKTSPHYHDSDGDGLVDLYDTNSKGAAANPPKASTTSTELAFRDASTESVLPVELLSFEATAKGGQVWVTWATATEENSDRFEIYRSQDGTTWSQAGTLRAAGSSQAKLSYTFTDREPYEGVSYYRLRMVDFDGKEDVSPVRQVTVGQSLSKTDVKVWPNPNEGYFTISITHADSSPALLTLYSMVGNVVWEKELSSEQTDEVVAGNIQAGTYLLHVSNATGVTVVKIIVQ